MGAAGVNGFTAEGTIMNTHEIKIAKRILDFLHELDGGQAHALTIHGDIGGLGLCSAGEFEATLAELDRRKWVIGVTTRFKGVLWNLSDAGAAARLEM
jgi:hypothetical protein